MRPPHMSAANKAIQRFAKASSQLNKAGAQGRYGSIAINKIGNLVTNTKAIKAFLPGFDSWWLLNTDTKEVLYGPFHAQGTTKNVGAAYSNTFSLNRQNSIKQFLHGEVPTISFTARFFSMFLLQEIESQVEKLSTWTERDEVLGRPPILQFWIGNRHAQMQSCVLKSVSTVYDRPGFLGSMRGATVNVTLEKYEPHSISKTALFDTRYHMARIGDTYEGLAASEYGIPMLGVEIRQRNPRHRSLSPGDVVKLPALSGSLRKTRIKPQSIMLSGLSSNSSSPQRTRFLELQQERSA